MNKRIIVIDDEESILNDYTMILSPARKNASALKERAALEAELFGEKAAREPASQECYDLTVALQGREGFEKVRQAREEARPFALAFIDIRMPPGWDGLQTARLIREADKDIEIVIVTAYSDRERREIVEKVGMPERLLYLKKPFDPDEIRQLALSLTRKWDLERKAESHKEYLEQLLDCVRRLKTQSISSVKEVLSAILKEVLHFVDARKGLMAKVRDARICIELISEDFPPEDLDSLLKQMEQFCRLNPNPENICWVDSIMVIPLRDLTGNFFILVLDIAPPVSSDESNLLKLLLETSSEVLLNFRKQQQLLKNEKVATIGQIAAGIIHEISSPLTAMSGAVDMWSMEREKIGKFFEEFRQVMEKPGLPEGLRDHFVKLSEIHSLTRVSERISLYENIFQKGMDRIQALTKNIHSFSKIRDAFEPSHHDVSEAIEDTLTLAHVALRTGIKVHRNWDSPLTAWCDCDGLKQVFLNIILNAVQAMEGVGEIWIAGRQDKGKILVSIRDSGSGMDSQAKEKIFEAFYTTKPDGTGLGLSIVRGIIDKHKGAIWVDSQPGKGTTFHIELPIKDTAM